MGSGTKLVIRVPATGWGSGLTETAARAIESHAATVRLIRQKTSMPVPEIFDFDTSCNNAIGAPYLCKAFVPGQPVYKIWFQEKDRLQRETLRRNILTSVAQNMAQLRCFSFSKIGSVEALEEHDNRESTLGPVYSWAEEDSSYTITVNASCPF